MSNATFLLKLAHERWNNSDTSEYICDNIQAIGYDNDEELSCIADAIVKWLHDRIGHRFSAIEYLFGRGIGDRVYSCDLDDEHLAHVYSFRLVLWDELNAAAAAGAFEDDGLTSVPG